MKHGTRKIKTVSELYELLDNIKNPTVGKALMTTFNKINDINYNKILCSISGGSDSDIVIDLINMFDVNNKVDYVFFNTGLEYEATKEHINYLQEKYNIKIETLRPKVPIPLACKRNGQPFLSKHVSEMMTRLQRHNFQWENESFEILYKKYPKCKSALQWWTNTKPSPSHNIKQNKLLKEFILLNPPTFNISQSCCNYAKKDLVKEKIKQGYDLDINGVRRSEGGARATAYKTCFDSKEGFDKYRPIFWFTDEDKEYYKNFFNIENSKCYSTYGLKRTGCCGCPFGRDYIFELNVLETFEPKLFKATSNIFKDSYDYTKKYKEFRESFRGE